MLFSVLIYNIHNLCNGHFRVCIFAYSSTHSKSAWQTAFVSGTKFMVLEIRLVFPSIKLKDLPVKNSEFKNSVLEYRSEYWEAVSKRGWGRYIRSNKHHDKRLDEARGKSTCIQDLNLQQSTLFNKTALFHWKFDRHFFPISAFFLKNIAFLSMIH